MGPCLSTRGTCISACIWWIAMPSRSSSFCPSPLDIPPSSHHRGFYFFVWFWQLTVPVFQPLKSLCTLCILALLFSPTVTVWCQEAWQWLLLPCPWQSWCNPKSVFGTKWHVAICHKLPLPCTCTAVATFSQFLKIDVLPNTQNFFFFFSATIWEHVSSVTMICEVVISIDLGVAK